MDHNPVDNLRTATVENWDTYGAAALTPEIIALADRIYDAIHFIPTSNGGFQIEFHAGGLDVEIEIDQQGGLEGVYVSRSHR